MSLERTFVMIKPDGVQRRKVGQIIDRFESKGLKLVGLQMTQLNEETAGELYGIHKERPFYPGLIKFVTGGPVVQLVIEGHRAISIVRTLLGATFSYEAAPGTIRGDFGASKGYNLIHGSDSPESAEREIGIFFADGVCEYGIIDDSWVYEDGEGR
jgi:nucleoside-diphosphate kinase